MASNTATLDASTAIISVKRACTLSLIVASPASICHDNPRVQRQLNIAAQKMSKMMGSPPEVFLDVGKIRKNTTNEQINTEGDDASTDSRAGNSREDSIDKIVTQLYVSNNNDDSKTNKKTRCNIDNCTSIFAATELIV